MPVVDVEYVSLFIAAARRMTMRVAGRVLAHDQACPYIDIMIDCEKTKSDLVEIEMNPINVPGGDVLQKIFMS